MLEKWQPTEDKSPHNSTIKVNISSIIIRLGKRTTVQSELLFVFHVSCKIFPLPGV